MSRDFVVALVCIGLAVLVAALGVRQMVQLEQDASAVVTPSNIEVPSREIPFTLATSSSQAAPVTPSSNPPYVSWICRNTTTSPVFVVAQGATSTTPGRGPFCTDTSICTDSPFGARNKRGFVLAGSGSPSLQCSVMVP